LVVGTFFIMHMNQKHYILFDDDLRKRLLPLTYTRPVCEMRIGILTLREKWALRIPDGIFSHITEPYLSALYPLELGSDNYIINGGLLPSIELIHAIHALEYGQALMLGEEILATRMNQEQLRILLQEGDIETIEGIPFHGEQLYKINALQDIFTFNQQAILDDFNLITQGRTSAPLGSMARAIGADHIFIEEGAIVEHAILNALEGPIYIGPHARVLDGAVIKGPVVIGAHAVIKMGAKIYGAASFGPYCKIGGEVKNSVIFDYSAKSHDGYLGDSVVGAWCNLGAGTNCSNLKNDYSDVKQWSYEEKRFRTTGLQFCGMVMGDYTKTAIGTRINTGAVIGVAANLTGAEWPPHFVPSFSMGTKKGLSTFPLEKVTTVAQKTWERRGMDFTEVHQNILKEIFERSRPFRRWDKA
jgi:UDP-N-acetylglucosamine diphosphorylase/glucosamine-1-phosphate N-acetyltransferase